MNLLKYFNKNKEMKFWKNYITSINKYVINGWFNENDIKEWMAPGLCFATSYFHAFKNNWSGWEKLTTKRKDYEIFKNQIIDHLKILKNCFKSKKFQIINSQQKTAIKMHKTQIDALFNFLINGNITFDSVILDKEWIDLFKNYTGITDGSIIAEIEFGEKSWIAHYWVKNK